MNISYFKNYQNIDEVVTIYKDGEKDVLLSQDVILLDTYEQIKLFVELKGNYILNSFLTMNHFKWNCNQWC